MKKWGLLGLLLIAGVSLPQCGRTPEVAVENREAWPGIEKFIRDNWDTYTDTMASLPHPYSFALNPGTLYYWDIYFVNEGLMIQECWEQARNNVDNFIYEIEKLGFIPNASGWGENRSMTPYFGMMVRSFYEKSPYKDKAWLKTAYEAVLKEYEFWTNTNGNTIEDHTSSISGLQRFSNHADSAYLSYFYRHILVGRFRLSGEVPEAEKVRTASQRLSEAEAMDFTPRFDGHCEDFIPVDLNANLWQYEKNLSFFERELGLSDGRAWDAKAKERSALIDQYLWSEERGLYLDYDFVNGKQASVAAITTLMPLYWGFTPPGKARRVRANLHLFEYPGGLVVCEPGQQPYHYQWGDDSVWAPMQFVAMGAMKNYNFRDDARRIATRWLNTVTRNFLDPQPATHQPFKYGDGTRHPGLLYEKYTRDGQINDAEYPCSHMLGWTAATFLRARQIVK